MKSERTIRSIVAKIRKTNADYDKYYENSLTGFEKEGIEHCRKEDVGNLLEELTDKEMEMLNEIMFGRAKKG